MKRLFLRTESFVAPFIRSTIIIVYIFIRRKLMLKNSNVYSYISGIFVSLATNILASLCIEKRDFPNRAFLLGATVAFLASSIAFMWLAGKLSRFQDYIRRKKEIRNDNDRIKIVKNAMKLKYREYLLAYAIAILTPIIGVVLLVIHLVLLK